MPKVNKAKLAKKKDKYAEDQVVSIDQVKDIICQELDRRQISRIVFAEELSEEVGVKPQTIVNYLGSGSYSRRVLGAMLKKLFGKNAKLEKKTEMVVTTIYTTNIEIPQSVEEKVDEGGEA